MGILQSPTVFSVIDVFVLQVVSTVLQSPTVFILFTITMLYSQCAVCVHQRFILFIAVSVFRVAHRATALRSYKAVENTFSKGFV